MEFDWDEQKAASSLTKHGVSFDYAARVFLDAGRVDLDASRSADGEQRRKVVGMIDERVFALVYTAGVGRSASSRRGDAMRRNRGSMTRFNLDRTNLPMLDSSQAARLDAMTDAELTAQAADDPDNPPLTDDELARIASARRVRAIRAQTGLSQQRFAATYRINLARCATWSRAAAARTVRCLPI